MTFGKDEKENGSITDLLPRFCRLLKGATFGFKLKTIALSKGVLSHNISE